MGNKLIRKEVDHLIIIMSEIKTLVYFDLEATGLKNSGRPRITELSFVAVNTKDVLELHSKLMTHLQEGKANVESILPRIMNKLTVCVYPLAIIKPEVSEITGLDNYNLSGQAIFDTQTGELLNSFLSRLSAPLCLVAHNGDKYDFPLLKAELEKAGITLPFHTLCADSYLGIKEIVSRKEEVIHSLIDNHMDIGSTENSETSSLTEILDIEYGDIEKENSRTPTKTSVRIKSQKKLEFFVRESPKSFSLINLHKQLVGSFPAQSHGAEADCLTLLRTTSMLGMEWVQWVQDNCYPINNSRKMWSYEKC